MKIKTNLSGIVSAASSGGGGGGGSRPQIGKVFGVITTKNTPTKALFEKVCYPGNHIIIGSILYTLGHANV